MALKEWIPERHGVRKDELAFWRHKITHGFVEVDKSQKGSPYFKEGKFYAVEANTIDKLRLEQFKTKSRALKYAKCFMRHSEERTDVIDRKCRGGMG